MFDQCWPTVYDVGPTLVKHWVDVLCFLASVSCVPVIYTLLLFTTYDACVSRPVSSGEKQQTSQGNELSIVRVTAM